MNKYWHSVALEKEKCNGCTICLRRCPTEAIRIRNGKARIIKERCIDCGECIRVCPYHAKKAFADDLDAIKKYKFKIALVSLPLYGQFTLDTDINRIFNCFYELGFDMVYDVAFAADLVTSLQSEILKNSNTKPLIATLCPAIIRLIQIRFPSLIDNIIHLESPMEIAARLAKQQVSKEHCLNINDIGAFYIAQCPAKITSIKKPIGIQESYINGAIPIKSIYTKLLKIYNDVEKNDKLQKASGQGIGWARVGGQSFALGLDNYLAVDGIENVIKVLEEIELGKLNNINFFEGYACVTGCIGGPLNVENPFIAQNRIRQLSKFYGENNIKESEVSEILGGAQVKWTEEIEPLGIMKLDSNIEKAIEKVELIDKIRKALPGIDCGSCGAPNCQAMAEDVVRGMASLEDCIIKLKKKIDK